MSEASFASLGPTLLARKGGAKPAMRPQLTPLAHSPEEMAALADEQLEDLGWNDMGEGHTSDSHGEPRDGASHGADIVPILPAMRHDAAEGDAANEDIAGSRNRSPVVRRQQKQLLDRVLADAAMDGTAEDLGEEEDLSARYFDDTGESDETGAVSANDADRARSPAAPVAAKAVGRIAKKSAGKRAAFTLRLDTDRHLKLRLAATMQGVSAQALVTEALDAMLGQIEDLDALVARMKRD